MISCVEFRSEMDPDVVQSVNFKKNIEVSGGDMKKSHCSQYVF